MIKKWMKIFFVIGMILSLCSFSYATTVMTGPADNEAQGDTATGDLDDVSQGWRVSDSGTVYTINVTTSDGNQYHGEVTLKDGADGSGGMQGYGSTGGDTMDSNPIPTGDVIIEPQDIADVFRENGFPEIADAIENGAAYDMNAEQALWVHDGDYQREWMSLDEVAQKIAEEKAKNGGKARWFYKWGWSSI